MDIDMNVIVAAVIGAFGTIVTAAVAGLILYLTNRRQQQANVDKTAVETRILGVEGVQAERQQQANVDKTAQETRILGVEERQAEVAFYRDSNVDLTTRMTGMEVRQAAAGKRHSEEMAAVIARQDAAQEQYEARVGSLRDKIDALKAEVELANKNILTLTAEVERGNVEIARANSEVERVNGKLDEAYATIKELRIDVTTGNGVITDLREQVTQLLVKLAEKNEETK